jgi:nucleoside-diphosphate-sugar epimerase
VTGAAGLIGSHVAALALQSGNAVRVMARQNEDVAWLAQAGAEVCRGDMGDRASLEMAVRGVDRVLHCAARMGPWGPASEYEVANVRGPAMLVEAAMAAGVHRFVHVSTIDVHGLDVGGPVDETAPYGTETDPYSRSKTAGERLVLDLIRDKGAPVTIVRPGWTYGPRDARSFARFAALVHQRKMVMIGAGNNHLPLIYVTDAARGIVLASDATQAVGKVYLLVSDEPVTQGEYLKTIASELGVPPPTRHVPYRLALALGTASMMAGRLMRMKKEPPLMRFGLQVMAGENRFLIDRARRELGWSPQVTVAEGVRNAVAWYRSTQRSQGA